MDESSATSTVTLKGTFTTAPDGGLLLAPPTNSPDISREDVAIIIGNTTATGAPPALEENEPPVNLAILLGILVPFVVFVVALLFTLRGMQLTIKRRDKQFARLRARGIFFPTDPIRPPKQPPQSSLAPVTASHSSTLHDPTPARRDRTPTLHVRVPAPTTSLATSEASATSPGGTWVSLLRSVATSGSSIPDGPSIAGQSTAVAPIQRMSKKLQKKAKPSPPAPGTGLAIVFLIDCSGSMANLSLIDTAERTLNGLLAELRGRDPTAHVTVITHSKPSARQAVLDTVIPLRSVGSLEGSHDQGSELHAKGGEAYSEALEEARRVLHDIKGLVTQRAIVMLGDGDVEGDALGESPTETCRALRDDGVPAYSILLNPSRAWLHMLRLSELTGGRELSNTATSAAMLDVILGGGD